VNVAPPFWPGPECPESSPAPLGQALILMRAPRPLSLGWWPREPSLLFLSWTFVLPRWPSRSPRSGHWVRCVGARRSKTPAAWSRPSRWCCVRKLPRPSESPPSRPPPQTLRQGHPPPLPPTRRHARIQRFHTSGHRPDSGARRSPSSFQSFNVGPQLSTSRRSFFHGLLRILPLFRDNCFTSPELVVDPSQPEGRVPAPARPCRLIDSPVEARLLPSSWTTPRPFRHRRGPIPARLPLTKTKNKKKQTQKTEYKPQNALPQGTTTPLL